MNIISGATGGMKSMTVAPNGVVAAPAIAENKNSPHWSPFESIFWPVPMFPETKKETRGSPALFVSGNFQGNQRVFGAPFWQLSSFPESESWSGAKSEAKPRKPGKYRGILPIWLILGPNQLISTEFPACCCYGPRGGGSPTEFPREKRKREVAVEKHRRKGNETGWARKHACSLTPPRPLGVSRQILEIALRSCEVLLMALWIAFSHRPEQPVRRACEARAADCSSLCIIY